MTDSTRVSENLRGHTAIYWGLLLSAAPLVVFAHVLYRHTHHRPLGAVTFVLGATAVLIAGLLVARRCKEKGGGLWLVCRIAALLSALLPILMLFPGR
ncbi:MAG TPA: hypothetical protein VHO25_04695 [Polyangiaceae bacterium]|nr:hypothetical protein [Polyangiaceae bacterium]